MEIFGLTFPLWTIVKTLLIIWLIAEIYDWLKILAWKINYKLPGPFPLPLVGTFPAYMKRKAKLKRIEELRKANQNEDVPELTMPPIIAGCIGSSKIITITDIDLAKKIFITDHVHFQNPFTIEGMIPPPLDKMLSNLQDSEWKRMRNVLSPAFSTSKLKKMTSEINYCASCLVSGLLDRAKCQEPADVKKHFGCFGLDVIASTSFGIRTDTYSSPDDPFTSAAEKAMKDIEKNPLILVALFFPNLMTVLRKCFKFSLMFRTQAGFFCNAMKEIIAERKEKNDTGRTDMLQLMLNAKQKGESEDGHQPNNKISEDEILAQGFMAFLGGYTTIATLMSFMSYVLATHPDIQDKLIKEIDEKVPADTAEIDYELALDMPYLDCVINETLRMYPPATIMQRMPSYNKDVEIDGHWFPGDTQITFSTWFLHHNPKYYPDPYTFKPERFSPEEKAKRDPFAFQAFGQGPRNCIGMRLALLEAKIATISMLRKLKFVKCAETMEPLEVKSDFMVFPVKPIKVGIELR